MSLHNLGYPAPRRPSVHDIKLFPDARHFRSESAETLNYPHSRRSGPSITSRDTNPEDDLPASSAQSFSSKTSSSVRSTRSYIRPWFRTRKIDKKEIEKPWLTLQKSSWPTIIPCFGFGIGLILIGLQIFLGVFFLPRNKYCLVMEDQFEGTQLNTKLWNTEVQLGGYGNGQFDMTTTDGNNIFVKDGKLIIKPTLQDASLLEADYSVLNLTANGTCTSTLWSDCWSATNSTNQTIVSPVRSGRINTKGLASIRYGRVEVTAKLPVGDWLWPKIWLLPVEETYGPWPASGEIDIAEARGNDPTYRYGGNNKFLSSLHWGPTPALDAYWRDSNWDKILHTSWSNEFHKFGLEWSDKYLYTYVDNRLRTVIYVHYKQYQWDRGQFPYVDENGTILTNPWNKGQKNTPFDTPFYLLLNLGVGGTNGFFPDPDPDKPWANSAVNASRYFWQAKDKWYPTWVDGQAQLEIDRVQMWQECN